MIIESLFIFFLSDLRQNAIISKLIVIVFNLITKLITSFFM